MLALLSTHVRPATDLIYLLRRTPHDVAPISLGFGSAYTVFPEMRHDRCELALVLDWTPEDWIKKKTRTRLASKHLDSVANDRSYAGTTFLASAISQIFKQALMGHCPERPELPNTIIPIEFEFPLAAASHQNKTWSDLFTPLGFVVRSTPIPSLTDPLYHAVHLSGSFTLQQALKWIVTLAPTLDPGPTYGVNPFESNPQMLDSVLSSLASHPHLEWIQAQWDQISCVERVSPDDRLKRLTMATGHYATLKSDEVMEPEVPKISKSERHEKNQIPESSPPFANELKSAADRFSVSNVIEPLQDPSIVGITGSSSESRSEILNRCFKIEEIVSMDELIRWIPDDRWIKDHNKSEQVESIFFSIIEQRLKRNLMTALDLDGQGRPFRNQFVQLAKKYHFTPTLIRLQETLRASSKLDQENFSKARRQEGFRVIYQICKDEFQDWRPTRRTSPTLRPDIEGAFDIIGDVHGCMEELLALTHRLGYRWTGNPSDLHPDFSWINPPGRRLFFVGDLVDRGPNSLEALRLVMRLTESGQAFCVPGNHDYKLARALGGMVFQKRDPDHDATLQQIRSAGPEFAEKARTWIESLPSHYFLDAGRLVVSHAGSKRSHHGRESKRILDFALYGDTTGKTDSHGLPERLNWALDYQGATLVVHGHTPVAEPKWVNESVNIDTGCVYGGYLTALRYPEREIISEPAQQEYSVSSRPLPLNASLRDRVDSKLGSSWKSNSLNPSAVSVSKNDNPSKSLNFLKHNNRSAEEKHSWSDFQNLKVVETHTRGDVILREDEVKSTVNFLESTQCWPWRIPFLAPGISSADPCQDLNSAGLENPETAFSYYRNNRVQEVLCVPMEYDTPFILALARDSSTAVERLGSQAGEVGIGFPVCGLLQKSEAPTLAEMPSLLERIHRNLSEGNFWERSQSNVAIFECSFTSHSAPVAEAKSQPKPNPNPKQLRNIMSQIASAGMIDTANILEKLERATEHGTDWHFLTQSYLKSKKSLREFTDWISKAQKNTNRTESIQVRNFQLLATQKKTFINQHYSAGAQILKPEELTERDPELFLQPAAFPLDLNNINACSSAVNLWKEHTQSGMIGWVIRPAQGAQKGRRGWVQPAFKCRGDMALKCVFGLNMTREAMNQSIQKNSLAARRSQVAREWALSLEALQRWTGQEPDWRIQECMVGMLAVKCEPTDARL